MGKAKKFFNGCFNFFWILLVGLISAISNGVIGIICCITIIGIPLGIQYFKFVKIVFAPAGKVVITKYSRHPVLNTFWIVFGGFLAIIIYFLLGLLLAITIIGLPLSKQLFKIMRFMCAPFGSEILKEGEYSKEKNLVYDIKLLNRRICANPQALINTEDGVISATEYIQRKQPLVDELRNKEEKVTQKTKTICNYLIIATIAVRVFIFITSSLSAGRFAWFELFSVFLFPIIPIIGWKLFFELVKHCIFYGMELRFHRKHLLLLIPYFPKTAPIASRKYKKLRNVFKCTGVRFVQDKSLDKMNKKVSKR